MKVLFIEPPVDYPNTIVNIGSNLGLLTIIAHVKKECRINPCFYSFEYAKALNHFMNIDQVIDHFNPDVICISVLTHSLPFSCELSYKAKKKGCIVIWGGIYVSQNISRIKEKDYSVDYFICGEGEFVLPELLNLLNKRFKKTFLSLNQVFQAKNINREYRCEIPAFSYIPKKLIKTHNLRATIETTRGCKYKCKFCSLNRFEYKIRQKSSTEFSQELENIYNHGFKKTIICDNNFIFDNQKKEIINDIKDKFEINLKFRITIRIDLLDATVLSEYKSLGVDEIIIGVEHIDKNILRGMNKTKRNADSWKRLVKKHVRFAADMGILVHPIFMFGWPGETKETLNKNKDFACELGTHKNVEPFIAFITPHPGNVIEKFVQDGSVKLITTDLSKYIHLYPVAIPISLGNDAIKYFVDAHNEIRIVSNMTDRNPCFDVDFVKEYSDLIQ